MKLTAGQIGVVTGAASGIGVALASRLAAAGLHVVLADVDDGGVATTAELVRRHGVEALVVHTDVSKAADVDALAATTLERFGAVHVVCNNAGVAGGGDPWFGPLSSWEWVLGVNLWGVVHGCRAFLPHLLGGGHIVNTASIAGLLPGFGPAYDASKHAVVAISEDLYLSMHAAGLPVGVSVVCPGWVRTNLVDADRNWPAELGDPPPRDPAQDVLASHVRRALEEGATTAAVADAVADAVEADRFWVIPPRPFLDLAVRRWSLIAQGVDPDPPEHVPGLPPRSQLMAEVMTALGLTPPS